MQATPPPFPYAVELFDEDIGEFEEFECFAERAPAWKLYQDILATCPADRRHEVRFSDWFGSDQVADAPETLTF